MGKTDLSLAIADDLDAEIVGADSRQIYRFLDIGTAKPRVARRQAVPHHLIDVVNPDEPLHAAIGCSPHIVVVGLSHRTTPVELRERLYFPEGHLEEPLEKLTQYTEVSEVVILSTCNRVELYGRVQHLAHGVARLRQFLTDYHSLPLDVFGQYMYTYHSEAALRHLFRVAASLDSLVVGEPQIMAQMKEAFAAARRANATGPLFNQLFEKAFAAAKRVRTETRIGEHAVSVSYAAIELAKKIFQDLAAKMVLIVGAGEMAELAALHLMTHGVKQLLVANRTLERAVELAGKIHGQAISLAEVPAYLNKVDIVVSSTGSPAYVIGKAEVLSAMKLRKNRPMFFIDIAVPRDIDPTVGDLSNVYLYDIDDLQHVVEENRQVRLREAALGEAIVACEVEQALRWLDEQEVVPAVVRLRRKAETIRKRELEKLYARLGHLSEADRVAIEAMASSIVNKLLHTPIVRVKQASQANGGAGYLQALHDLFSLDE